MYIIQCLISGHRVLHISHQNTLAFGKATLKKGNLLQNRHWLNYENSQQINWLCSQCRPVKPGEQEHLYEASFEPSW